jgi:hypothetical protein
MRSGAACGPYQDLKNSGTFSSLSGWNPLGSRAGNNGLFSDIATLARRSIPRRNGIDHAFDHTLEEVGKRLSVTREPLVRSRPRRCASSAFRGARSCSRRSPEPSERGRPLTMCYVQSHGEGVERVGHRVPE